MLIKVNPFCPPTIKSLATAMNIIISSVAWGPPQKGQGSHAPFPRILEGSNAFDSPPNFRKFFVMYTSSIGMGVSGPK